MYTFEPPILYSEDALRGVSLRSASKLNKFKLLYSKHDAVRSFLGGFSSTAGYVPGNEAQVPKDKSGVTPVWLIISKGRCPFLSGQLE